MTSKLQSLTAAAVLAAGVLAAPSASAEDVFLKLGKIQGESLDAKHANEIDVLSWSWGLSGATTRQGACVNDLNIMKVVDAASPAIMIEATVGQSLGSASMTVRSSGLQAVEYFYVVLTDVKVTSVQISGASERPTESVSLGFSYADWTYHRRNPDGSLGPPMTARVYSGKCG